MISIEKKAIPYLCLGSLLGGFSIFCGIKAVNEFCGFCNDEFKGKKSDEKINFQRLINACAWTCFAGFSSYGCYWILRDFSDVQRVSWKEIHLNQHEMESQSFQTFFHERKSERNSIRNFCWNYLQSSEALSYLEKDPTIKEALEAMTYASRFTENLNLEQAELKQQLSILREGLKLDFVAYQDQLKRVELAKGLFLDHDALCQTPYSWLNTQTCLPYQKQSEIERVYEELQSSIERYRDEILSYQALSRCKKDFSPSYSYERVLEAGQIAKETLENSSGIWGRLFNLF